MSGADASGAGAGGSARAEKEVTPEDVQFELGLECLLDGIAARLG